MNCIRTIIIDDERSAREELKRALKSYPHFAVVGEATNADEAKQQIEAHHPDVIFLDIQMPGPSGFDLLESLDEVPAVVFTTAFNQYAVQAFEINALDYLVKPVREERFAKAIEKIQDSIQQKKDVPADRQLFIKDGERYHFVRMGDIYLLESLDNYSRVHFNGKKALLKRSLRQWEDILDNAVFFRINRIQIINIQFIREVQAAPNGRLIIQLATGESLEVSSRQSVKFKNLGRS
jgi:two-component system LytT family response regulator